MALQIIAAYFYQDNASSESSSNLHLTLPSTGMGHNDPSLWIWAPVLQWMSFEPPQLGTIPILVYI